MLVIDYDEQGRVTMSGRLDAAQAARAQEFFDAVTDARIIDVRNLEYISSAGLKVLIRAHKRMMMAGRSSFRLVNVNRQITDAFAGSGLDWRDEVESADSGD